MYKVINKNIWARDACKKKPVISITVSRLNIGFKLNNNYYFSFIFLNGIFKPYDVKCN